MKAALANDKCFSTVSRYAYNTDLAMRDHIDIDEARTAFDFDIIKHQSCTEDGRPIGKQFHLRRSDDDAIIPSRGLGDEFKPVQHRDVFNYIVNDIMPKCPSMKLETVGTMHGGGTGVIMAKFGDDFTLPGDKSPNEQRLFFFNPNGKSSLVVGMTTVRLFCQNQLGHAISSASANGFRVWHTTNASVNVDNALRSIADEVESVRYLRQREERLATIPVTERDLINVVNTVFPLSAFEEGSKGWTRMVNQRNEVVHQFTDGETAQEMDGQKTGWTLFNSITRQIYNPTSIGKGTDLQQITYAGTVGSRAARVQRIFQTVEDHVLSH